jgi:hypothetical protein
MNDPTVIAMTIQTHWIIIMGFIQAAIFLFGPFVILRLQDLLQARATKRERKENILRTLMSHRIIGPICPPELSQSLNMVPVEFYGKKFKNVIRAWRFYFDHLNSFYDPIVWTAKQQELLSSLIVEIGRTLGYEFDEITIKNTFYSPKIKQESEAKDFKLRDNLLNISEQIIQILKEENK